MQIHPTRGTTELASVGLVGVGLGLILREPAVLAWSGALLAGLTVARAVTYLSVARIRAAGFEMLWREEPRTRSVARGETFELAAEIRNRDTAAARYVSLRAIASPELEIRIEPEGGEVPAGGRLRASVHVRAPRVGRYGIHGLSLEVQGAPGLFEVPLTFANPYGIEVLPAPWSATRRLALGGRARRPAEIGRPGPLVGEGDHLRELRELVPGDPFKRIAWKASARRGKLMVREYEREERDVVWLVLDASVELWAGELGTAPLDLAIEEVAAVAQRHLGRGDPVGLAVLGARVLAWIAPTRGPAQAVAILRALSLATGTLDGDRSDLDEHDVALRVLEHLRPLDPEAAHRVRASDLDRVARRAERGRARGPFTDQTPWGATPREITLRRYLAAFGLGSPPRQEPERSRTDHNLAEALGRITRERPLPSIVYVWSPAVEASARREIAQAIATFPRRRTDLRWVPMSAGPSVPTGAHEVARAVADAVRLRVAAAERKGERDLGRLGVRVEHLRTRGDTRRGPEP